MATLYNALIPQLGPQCMIHVYLWLYCHVSYEELFISQLKLLILFVDAIFWSHDVNTMFNLCLNAYKFGHSNSSSGSYDKAFISLKNVIIALQSSDWW